MDGRVATLTMDVREDGGIRPGYELKLNSYDLGVDIELYDARPAAALRAPRGRAVVVTVGQGARLLRRRQHPDARPVEPRLQGELLQVHQRDAQRHRGGERRVGAGLPRRAATAPAPAAATSSRWPATGSSWSTTATPRSRSPRCRCSACCREPAGSPVWWTSARSGATSPTSSARSPRASRGSARSSGGSSTSWCRARARRDRARRGAAERAARSDRPAGAPRHRADAARPHRRGRPDRLRARRVPRSTASAARRRSRCRARPAIRRPTRRGGPRSWATAGGRSPCVPRARRRAPPPAAQRGGDRRLVLRTEGERRPRSSPSTGSSPPTPSDWLVREIRLYLARTLRRLDASRARSSRSSSPARASPGRSSSSRSPPTAPTCSTDARGRRPAAGDLRLTALNAGAYPMPHGLTRLAGPLPRRPRTRVEALKARIGTDLDAGRRRRGRAGDVRADDIDWDDEVRIAIEERASLSPGRADRHGGDAALRRARRPWRARSSAACPPGRTGSSSARTRSARRARCALYGTGQRARVRPEESLMAPSTTPSASPTT